MRHKETEESYLYFSSNVAKNWPSAQKTEFNPESSFQLYSCHSFPNKAAKITFYNAVVNIFNCWTFGGFGIRDTQEMYRKRLTIFENGTNNCKIIKHPDTNFPAFLADLRNRFQNPDIKCVYTSTGAEIANVDLIMDYEVLYVSDGGPFIPPTTHAQAKKPLAISNGIANGHAPVDTGPDRPPTQLVKLNVGGVLFETTKGTIAKASQGSTFAKYFDSESDTYICENGVFFIDRDPKYFGPILNFLRTGTLLIDPCLSAKGVIEQSHSLGIEIPEESILKDDEPTSNDPTFQAFLSQVSLLKEQLGQLGKLTELSSNAGKMKLRIEVIKLCLDIRKEYHHVTTTAPDIRFEGLCNHAEDLKHFEVLTNYIQSVWESLNS